jgi:hypothetical protein
MAQEKREYMESEAGQNLLLHAVINQLETDFDDQEYDAMDELITMLMKNPDNHEILFAYLSDTAQSNWLEGKTNCRF